MYNEGINNKSKKGKSRDEEERDNNNGIRERERDNREILRREWKNDNRFIKRIYKRVKVGEVKVDIELYTYQNFYQKLIDIIPVHKWFIKSDIPATCLNKQDVMLLIKDKKALLI